ncbi:MAG: SprT family zinc-dependent metalloprotease [Bdellovibrionota bacterium]
MQAFDFNEAQRRLTQLFWDHNFRFFGGILVPIEIQFSGRLKTTGGQYFRKPVRRIQISTRYFEMESAWDEIADTLGHEMVHYWLDFLGHPCGHTAEFRKKLKHCGFHRYSRLTPVKARYLYLCPRCSTQYFRRKKGVWSCGPCSGARYNPNFRLVLAAQANTI